MTSPDNLHGPPEASPQNPSATATMPKANKSATEDPSGPAPKTNSTWSPAANSGIGSMVHHFTTTRSTPGWPTKKNSSSKPPTANSGLPKNSGSSKNSANTSPSYRPATTTVDSPPISSLTKPSTPSSLNGASES